MTDTQKQSNNNNSNNINLHHCHWLPCSIDYDGLAPIHIHFQPETITTLNDNDDSNNNNNNKDDNNKTIIQAASFRGRGLLSKTYSTSNTTAANDQQPAKTLPLGIIGSVLSIDEHQQHHHHRQQEQEQQSNNNHLPMLITKEKFDTILEWEHESNENNLIQVEDLNIVEEEEGKEMSNDDMKLMYDTQTQGSIGKSLAIFDILDAVHTPIPVEEEE